jgi:vacuolar-type H+-ATPase subunit H
VALVALVVIWLVASIQRRPPGEEAQRILDEARNEAKAIVAAAEAKAAELTAAAAESAGRTAAQMTREAGRTAGDMIRKAEEKSWDLVAAAELQRTLARREAIQVQKLADGVRCDLTEMVSDLLAGVERSPGSGPTNGHAGTNGASPLKSRVGSD